MKIKLIKMRSIKTILTTALLVIGIIASTTQSTLASDGRSKALAIQIAESQTRGKAVRAKYIQTAEKSGFNVRLLKDGKVIHTFISMQRINKE